jgi:hypothetical protein
VLFEQTQTWYWRTLLHSVQLVHYTVIILGRYNELLYKSYQDTHNKLARDSKIVCEQPKNLMRFVGNHRQDMPKGITYSLIDYCELVDCTGCCIREDKVGYIEQPHSPILARLGLDAEQWLTLTTEFEQHFSTAVGIEQMLQRFKHHTGHQGIRGMAKARVLLQHA